MDVDGVLTDGGIVFDGEGGELKRFCVTDGFAIKLAQRLGIATAVITGRSSAVVARRADDLGIKPSLVRQGSKDKLADLRSLCAEHGLRIERTAYIGDDWPDLGVMRVVALAIAPANAAPEVKKIAHLVTSARGGHGAVREGIEHVLRVTGRFSDALHLYDQPSSPPADGPATRPTY
ncbi:MAG: HAD hydrolase family protein [Thermoleophilia bacterium]|nr:HAD hydrolase family protein [Thermoleophilia bacterium]